MRKITTYLLALLACSAAVAQNRVADQDRLTNKVTFDYVRQQQILKSNSEQPILRAKDFTNQSQLVTPTPAHKVTAVSPVEMGRASNAFSCLRGEQNQVAVIDSSGVVAFIHRQDVTIFGGGGAENGKLRYDLSIDQGRTWTSDIGVLNQTYTRPTRYPNITGYNGSGTANPFDSKLVWVAPSLDPQPDWDGHATGVSEITTGAPTSTETYSLLAQRTLLPGGLCQGLPGEFWTTDIAYNGASLDTIYVYKGTWNATSQDVDWLRVQSVLPSNPGHATSFDGAIRQVGPNIAFSPDGMTGYLTILGDLEGVSGDSTYAPVLWKTTDGGATWGAPVEVDLNAAAAWVSDSLQAFWTDSLGNPASSGRATTAFDFDVTVDANGNPHVISIIGSASGSDDPAPTYSIFPGLTMFAADIWSSDGGTTWDIEYLGPVLSFRGEFGVPDAQGDLLSMDNHPQIGRSEDGTHIFYSWVDSDTLVTGFGESNNLAPNSRIAALRITDGMRTCWKMVGDGDIIWDGKMLFPNMSPVAISKNNGGSSCWNIPLVVLDMITNDQLAPCRWWYFGNDATFDDSEFTLPIGPQANLGWGSNCYTQSPAVCTPVSRELPIYIGDVNLFQSYPNPTSGDAEIEFEISQPAELSLDMVNMYGQQVMEIAKGEYEAGQHGVTVSTRNLAAGIYYYNLRIADQVFTKKMVVTK